MTQADLPATLVRAAVEVLSAADPRDKVALTGRFSAAWRAGAIAEIGEAAPATRPARPARPPLVAPRDLRRRRIGRSREGRVVLFPSYFYHRTIPFESDEQRISIAFDLMPHK